MSMLFQTPKDARWYIPGPCPAKLQLDIADFSVSLAVNFAGRGKALLGCGTDIYVTNNPAHFGGDQVLVDVWAAYRAGVWTSSTTILVYSLCALGPLNRSMSVKPLGSSSPVSKNIIFHNTSGCPTTLQATITVNADGTYSIV